MVPENNKYEEFGRSTKLLLHPKDMSLNYISLVEDSTNSTVHVDVNDITQSLVEIASTRQETGEILPELSTDCNDNAGKGKTTEIGKTNGIPRVKRDMSAHNETGESQKGNWFTFSSININKLSNALREGMFGKQGGCTTDMAMRLGPTDENREFSFFL